MKNFSFIFGFLLLANFAHASDIICNVSGQQVAKINVEAKEVASFTLGSRDFTIFVNETVGGKTILSLSYSVDDTIVQFNSPIEGPTSISFLQGNTFEMLTCFLQR